MLELSLARLIAMVERGEESWAVVLDRLAAVLLCEEPVSMQPRLVTAALYPVGYLLAREIVSRANMLAGSKDKLLSVLLANLDILRYKTGANVLRGLHGAMIL